MSINASNVQAGYEPIAGYTLRKRLGAGGFGEVWLADAPGGLQKAVKILFGAVHDAQASRELRSLQRISKVYHPFLLSLERIEVTGNQAIIVTELAESSLQDRFEQCRRKGAPGIARGILLEFLRDAADALDFLGQKHSLQHLDIKPGNLLIIADRIKVADFGLIKDLNDQDQSLIGGLTPIYSAPEIFDGRPDYRSDQYSLAIVFMEMLTGHLPFLGKSTGELARQHIGQVPDLEALPPADRAIVTRALSKNPIDRYATCRQFIEQLLKVKHAALPLPVARGSAETPTKTNSLAATEIQETITSPSIAAKLAFQPCLNTDDVLADWNPPNCLFIGLGGLAAAALVELRRKMNADCDNRLTIDDHQWLAIDTDAHDLDETASGDPSVALSPRSILPIPILHPRDYRNADPGLYSSLSRRWLYNIPRSLKTEGVRPLAVLAFLNNYQFVKSAIRSALQQLLEDTPDAVAHPEPIRVYLMSSMHGGTGSGLLGEIGLLVGSLLRELNCTNARVCGFGSVATAINSTRANLAPAAALATLSELTSLMSAEQLATALYYEDRLAGPIRHKPFDWLTLVDGGLYADPQDVETTIQTLSQAVFLDSQSICGAVLDATRAANRESQPDGWLRALRTAKIRVTERLTPGDLARWCCEQTLVNAASYMRGKRGQAHTAASARDSTFPAPTVSGDLPLTDNACKDHTERLLQKLGFVGGQSTIDEMACTKEGHRNLQLWARRLSGNSELINAQLTADLAVWKRSIAKVVQQRIYNWKQVEQLQLNVIERILDFCENQTEHLISLFMPFERMIGPVETMRASAVAYLHRYAEKCLTLSSNFQMDGKSLAIRLSAWCESIVAEKELNDSTNDITLLALPPRLQLLASRVNAVLDSAIHRLSLQIVDSAFHADELSGCDTLAKGGIENVNLKYVLSLAGDLVARFSHELNITPEEFGMADATPGESVAMRGLASFIPAAAHSGGNIYRIVIASADQLPLLDPVLAGRKISSTTTLVPTSRSMGSHIFCEASNLQIAALATAMWRPSTDTLLLAERLRTRVDVEWQPVSRLLEMPADSLDCLATSAQPQLVPIAITDELHNTQPVSSLPG